MKELVLVSLNILYIKDTLQMCDRLIARLQYSGFSTGTMDVQIQSLKEKKRTLNIYMKDLLEELLNGKSTQTGSAFNIDVDCACFSRKELERGYALFTNVRNVTFALDIRKGSLLIIHNPETNSGDPNRDSLEYTARHEGPVYSYFQIDPTDVLKDGIRH